jgi:hypothetical protein
MSRRFSDFLMASSFFYSNKCSGSVLYKNGGFALCWPLAHAKIVCDWPPVTDKLYPNGRQSHANCTRVIVGHSGTICMQLADTREQFVCDWLPVASIFCMRLAATRVQVVFDWQPDAHYISSVSDTVFNLISSRQ